MSKKKSAKKHTPSSAKPKTKQKYPKVVNDETIAQAVADGILAKRNVKLNDNGTVKMPNMGPVPSAASQKDALVRKALIENLIVIVNEAQGRIVSLNQRIDNIINAHIKCKSLKGL